MERPWSLYNKAEKLQIDDLTIPEIKVIILSIAKSRMSEWYACQAGDPQWKPLSSVSLAEKTSSQFMEKRRPMFEEAPDLSNESTLALEAAPTDERRSARRYKRHIKFVIELSPTQVFRCATNDISMNGASLMEILPGWTPKTFRAKMELGPDKVRVLCKRVSENQVQILEAEPWELIRQWIVHG